MISVLAYTQPVPKTYVQHSLVERLQNVYAKTTAENMFNEIDDQVTQKYINAVAAMLQHYYPNAIVGYSVDAKKRDQDVLVIASYTLVHGGILHETLLSLM